MAGAVFGQDPEPQLEEDPIAALKRIVDGAPPANGEGLQFSFEGAPWRDVVKWLAESDGLALHISDLPTGSFTYSDLDTYSTREAIDRVNLFLLPQSFALVQTGRLLSLINLADRQSRQQLDSLAKMVTLDQLDQLPSHDVVKCIFELGELDSDDAIEELSAFNLMTVPAVFPKTNRILVTDTAGKLRSVKTILESFEPRTLDNGTVVKSFRLKHVDAEDVLLVARPHLGLATGEMIGIDVSLSSDLKGKNIFVTGVDDKVKLIENLVLAIDVPKPSASAANGDAKLMTYRIEGGNIETVYNVLQTLLVGQDEIRLSADEAAGTIVALAGPDAQAEIAATIEQLKVSENEFEVIQLKSVDPYFAISLLEEMLDLEDTDDEDDELEWWERGRRGNDRDSNEKTKVPPPKIDADTANMRLYVRGRRYQIDEIKKIIDGLDEGATTGGVSASSQQIRIYPLRGPHTEKILRTAARFWQEANPVFYYPIAEIDQPNVERVVTATLTIEQILTPEKSSRAQSAMLLTKGVPSQAPAIRCQQTIRGLLLQCEDVQVLDKFEELLRTLTGPGDVMPSPPIVFYLKYTRASDAIQMLAELFDGGEAASENENASLVNGVISNSGSFLSSIITSREGTMTMMSGTITVVADTRLNRLIAQGTSIDLEKIESYLKIIDKDNSITSIETYGVSRVVELEYAKASDVAVSITEAYGSRIAGGKAAGSSTGQPGQSGRPPERETDKKNVKQTPPKPTASQAARDLEPKMTLTVHELSNSLVVTAPEALFREVEALALLLDQRSKKTVRILSVPDSIPLEYLQQFLGDETGGTSISTGRTSSSKSSSKKPVKTKK